ncbi:MAG: DNA mismatch repair endonuclease MutL [Firmicutes bacterium]|nr:DNA mismatch repair endonuclease MutL [Bacillota bacterium]
MIKVLEKNIADKIAAGEVIERPVSIVKELVENAVDAGATSIVVEIRNGGKSYIRVTDDGCGIHENEVETAFLRHATSKITTVRDLDAIETLGFRGEALASIGAVSRTEILTKCRDTRMGTRVLFHGGEVVTHEPTGCPDGTTLIVTDLFYNTPARLKFLKSDGAESSLIIDFLSQMSLAYQSTRFRLVNNGTVLFHTGGGNNRLHTIAKVYKNVNPKLLTEVAYEAGNMRLEGYISTPAQSKNTRASQIFFVNGRVVKSKVMEKGIAEGYRERLFEGRYPVAYLFLETDPSDLDVNIHPNKREVRFDKEQEVIDFIARGIKAALGTKEAMVSGTSLFKETPKEYSEKEEQVDIKILLSNVPNLEHIQNEEPEPVTIEPVTSKLEHIPPSIKKIKLPSFEKEEPQEQKVQEVQPALPPRQRLAVKPPALKPFDMDGLNITGCIFNTYITAIDEDAFYLIDQHAAHERIFYEKLVREYENEEKARQPILMPLMLEVALTANEERFTWITALRKMGYTLEAFGMNTYRVTEIPTFMTLTEAEDFLHDFVESVADSTDLRNHVVIDKLIMKSCKSAVKGGDRLSMEEMSALLKDLKGCVNPFSCPHGRPTLIRMTRYEIERLFKRIQS